MMLKVFYYALAFVLGYLLHYIIAQDKLVEKQGFIHYVDTVNNQYVVETDDDIYYITSKYPLPEPNSQILITTPK